MSKCSSCSRDAVIGRKHCERCLSSNKNYAARVRAEAPPGVCPRCRKKAVASGMKSCPDCLRLARGYSNKARASLPVGVCKCGRPTGCNLKTCTTCRDRVKKRYHQTPEGICPACKKTKEDNGKRYCNACRDVHRKRYAEIPKGKCTHCNPKNRRDSMPGRRECVECYDKLIRSEYGISTDERRDLETKQHGRCAICNDKPHASRRLSIDHDHATGAVRGLLCTRCNTTIGLLNDSPELIRKMLEYCQRHSQLRLVQ